MSSFPKILGPLCEYTGGKGRPALALQLRCHHTVTEIYPNPTHFIPVTECSTTKMAAADPESQSEAQSGQEAGAEGEAKEAGK